MITTDRKFFVGVHTTIEVKHRLEEEALRRGMSVSLLVHRICVQALNMQPKPPFPAGHVSERQP